jgi:2-amino-4-hydroxy-6-hydroxymethyldihydropteridine diphosphokinase
MRKWKWNAVAKAYIALGSNLGDRFHYLHMALDGLGACGRLEAVSSVYETEPIGGPPGQAWYLNMVVGLNTSLTASDLLASLLEIEARAARVRRQKNGPRTLDLDLLLFDDLVLSENHLILPHPRMAERRFVLEPLAEVHPQVEQIVGLDFRRAWARVQGQALRRLGALTDERGKPGAVGVAGLEKSLPGQTL